VLPNLLLHAIKAIVGPGNGLQAGLADGFAAGGTDPVNALIKTLERPLDGSPHVTPVLAQAGIYPRLRLGKGLVHQVGSHQAPGGAQNQPAVVGGQQFLLLGQQRASKLVQIRWTVHGTISSAPGGAELTVARTAILAHRFGTLKGTRVPLRQYLERRACGSLAMRAHDIPHVVHVLAAHDDIYPASILGDTTDLSDGQDNAYIEEFSRSARSVEEFGSSKVSVVAAIPVVPSRNQHLAIAQQHCRLVLTGGV